MDRVPLVLELTPEQHQQIEDLAHQRGYETPTDYIVALIAFDVETTNESLVNRFRRSLLDATEGRIHPIESLWDGIDDQ